MVQALKLLQDDICYGHNKQAVRKHCLSKFDAKSALILMLTVSL